MLTSPRPLRRSRGFILAGMAVAGVLAAPPARAQEACLPLSGGITVTAVASDPVRVLGTVTGTLRGATQARVVSQANGADGTVRLQVTHDFVTDDRSSLTTEDEVTWTPIPARAGVFAMQTRYRVVRGTGRFANARGEFRNQGEADTALGLLTLAYRGEICGVR